MSEEYKIQVDEKIDNRDQLELKIIDEDKNEIERLEAVIATNKNFYRKACCDQTFYNYPKYKDKVLKFQEYMKLNNFESYKRQDDGKSYTPNNYIDNDNDGFHPLMDQLLSSIADVWNEVLKRSDKQIRDLKSHFENLPTGSLNIFRIHIAWRVVTQLEKGIIDREKIKENLKNFKWLFNTNKTNFGLYDEKSNDNVIKIYNSAYDYYEMMSIIEGDNRGFTPCKFMYDTDGKTYYVPKYISFNDINEYIENHIKQQNIFKDNYMNMDEKIYSPIRAKNKLAMIGIIAVFILQSINIGLDIEDKEAILTRIICNVIALLLFVIFSCISINISSINDYDAAYAEYISDTWSDFSDITLLMFKNPGACGCKKFTAKTFLCCGHRFMCSKYHKKRCC